MVVRRLAAQAWLAALLSGDSTLQLAVRPGERRGVWAGTHGDTPDHVLVVCLRGALRVRHNGVWLRLTAGQAVLLPPAPDRLLASTRGGIAVRRCNCRFVLTRRGERLDLADAIGPVLAGSMVEPLLTALRLATHEPSRRYLLAALLSGLLAAPPSARGGGRMLAPADRDRVQALLARATGPGPTPADLAEACGLRLDYFTRLFRRTFGHAPRRYLLAERMRRAAEALRAGATLADAAAGVACGNPSLFNRQFRLVFGCAPGAWRRRALAEIQRTRQPGP